MRRSRFGLALFLLSAASLFIIGCGGDSPVPVSGIVRFKGKPMPSLVVHFVPESGNESRGNTNDNGEFKLNFQRGTEGALRGKHKVYFEYRFRDPQEEEAIRSGKGTFPADVKTILDRYGKAATTTLNYEVTRSGQDITIDLE
jgi:hypothetical protein